MEDYKSLSKAFYAGFWRRIFAYLIDLSIVYSLADLANKFYSNNMALAGISLYVAIIHIVYFVFATYTTSQTIGKAVLGIRVESHNGDKPSFSDILFREIVGRLITSLTTFISCLFIIFSGTKKSIHDYVADTVVVKEELSHLRRKLNKNLKKTID